jgi:hypothetical protein
MHDSILAVQIFQISGQALYDYKTVKENKWLAYTC